MKSQITWKNIKFYIQGNWRAFLLENFPQGIDKHIEEQFYFRLSQIQKNSPECLKKGKCKHCGCDTKEMALSDKICTNNPPCYGPFLNEEQWEKFKTFIDDKTQTDT